MTVVTKVERLETAGFPIGPHSTSVCNKCPHIWGDHSLLAEGDPIDGGIWTCPNCDCAGTWSLGETARMKVLETRERLGK